MQFYLLKSVDSDDNSKPASSSLHEKLLGLRQHIARHAQDVYDNWEQDGDGMDAEFGAGGICGEIANGVHGLCSAHDIDTIDGGHDGDDHDYVFAHDDKDAFGIDIHPSHYESGGGYNWKKKAGVKFSPEMVSVYPINHADLHHDDDDDDDSDKLSNIAAMGTEDAKRTSTENAGLSKSLSPETASQFETPIRIKGRVAHVNGQQIPLNYIGRRSRKSDFYVLPDGSSIPLPISDGDWTSDHLNFLQANPELVKAVLPDHDGKYIGEGHAEDFREKTGWMRHSNQSDGMDGALHYVQMPHACKGSLHALQNHFHSLYGDEVTPMGVEIGKGYDSETFYPQTYSPDWHGDYQSQTGQKMRDMTREAEDSVAPVKAAPSQMRQWRNSPDMIEMEKSLPANASDFLKAFVAAYSRNLNHA